MGLGSIQQKTGVVCRLFVLLLLAGSATSASAASYTLFDSGPVRPLAKSPDGTKLFATNIPDNRLEIFTIGGGGALTHSESVAVGLEPVAVAARTNTEVWVVNHLSDSISIVDLSTSPAHVVRTLLVGDEPRDIVFANPSGSRAFITCAHRGQNNPNDPQLTTPGVGRADVWVFDATNLGATLAGTPLTIITLFTDTPRALAVSPNGNTVYAAGFHTGNQTTTVSEGAVCDDSTKTDTVVQGPCSINGVTMPGSLPLPTQDSIGEVAPEVGLIVKYNAAAGQWQDKACAGGTKYGWSCSTNADCPGSTCGRNWNNAVKFNLPDKDVFLINATANPPVAVAGGGGYYTGVGTILFNMIANPVSGKLYVSNFESRNDVRFEGPGVYSSQFGGTTVQGHLAESRISILSGGTVTTRHLNKHIDYSQRPAPAGVKDNSLATPTDMAITADGSTLYVAAFGSSKVGVFNTTQLENNTFTPDNSNYITVTGGGPGGVLLNETFNRLYVLTRFDNGIAVVDTTTKAEVDHISLYDPEPASVVNGRPFLYDAFLTSSNGETACASCHIFGDFDSLAWDLGNPDDVTTTNPMPVKLSFALGNAFRNFHPMKGPMTTQTLRGMNSHGAMHWRGDRNGGSTQQYNEDLAFKAFNVAFPGLVGRNTQLTTSEMQAYTDFILQVTLPPNPNRALDNSLTTNQSIINDFFFGNPRRADGASIGTDGTDGAFGHSCNGCHQTSRANQFFGTDGKTSFENEPQVMKIAHLRNLYQKVGMFGMTAVNFFNAGNNGNQGDQVRGFGFLHDGSADTLFRFFNATVFNNANGNGFGFTNATLPTADDQRRAMESLVLAFDTNLFPIVGQQVTLTSTNSAVANPRINLLLARAALGETDVVVKGQYLGIQRGWYRNSGGNFQSDRSAELITDAALRSIANTAGQELTYTAVPPGSGIRIGVDRDEDTYFDRDEVDGGSDPADPNSIPGAAFTPTPTNTATRTGTATRTPTRTSTPTTSPTNTASPTDTPTPTQSPTETESPTPTITPGGPTLTPTGTATETGTPTQTGTPTNTSTPLPPTHTFTPTETDTPTETPIPTETDTPTETPTPTVTQSPTPTLTETPIPLPPVFCISGSVIQAPKLKVSANLTPAGDEKIALSGKWQVHSMTPPINPVQNGLRFGVYDKDGTEIYTRIIPGGLRTNITGPGWKLSPSGSTASYRDDSGSVGGIRKATVRSSTRQIGLFSFKISGKLSDFTVPPGKEPVQMLVILGDEITASNNQCAQFSFNPVTGVKPRCKASLTGNTLTCH